MDLEVTIRGSVEELMSVLEFIKDKNISAVSSPRDAMTHLSFAEEGLNNLDLDEESMEGLMKEVSDLPSETFVSSVKEKSKQWRFLEQLVEDSLAIGPEEFRLANATNKQKLEEIDEKVRQGREYNSAMKQLNERTQKLIERAKNGTLSLKKRKEGLGSEEAVARIKRNVETGWTESSIREFWTSISKNARVLILRLTKYPFVPGPLDPPIENDLEEPPRVTYNEMKHLLGYSSQQLGGILSSIGRQYSRTRCLGLKSPLVRDSYGGIDEDGRSTVDQYYQLSEQWLKFFWEDNMDENGNEIIRTK